MSLAEFGGHIDLNRPWVGLCFIELYEICSEEGYHIKIKHRAKDITHLKNLFSTVSLEEIPSELIFTVTKLGSGLCLLLHGQWHGKGQEEWK